ncbi:hypothetical protein [Acidithiobacillus sp. AMEEHan]|uniref:hypothetical protein n=1 Tax=Acidithiobacillus sp. AMEEHan TaxID=2994951 RepID=UPI0027E484C5|nr:hypothetical protein [Acidithiobacillus sp. AMEEHan]
MLRIWIAEIFISLLLGAVVYRLAFAFLQKYCCAWVVSLASALLLGVGISGVLDFSVSRHALQAEAFLPPEWLVQLSRVIAYLLGAAVVHVILKKRESLGFGPQQGAEEGRHE